MKVVSDDSKAELNLKIDKKIAVLNEIKNTVQTATTKEELVSAANRYRHEVKNTAKIRHPGRCEKNSERSI